jgi:hypothetical protein
MGSLTFAMLFVLVIGTICIFITLKSSNGPESATSWECDTCGVDNPSDVLQCSECGMDHHA